MLDGQGHSIHPDRQHRIPVVGERLDRGSGGPTVGRGGQHHVGVGGNSGRLQQITHPISGPGRVGDEVTADRVGHTRQGHGLLDRLEFLQILEGVGHFFVDHAVNAQPPVGAGQLGHAQRGVDPVELVVRSDETSQCDILRLHPGRRRRRRGSGGGQRERVAVAGHRLGAPGEHGAADPAGHTGERKAQGRQRQPPAPVDPVDAVISVDPLDLSVTVDPVVGVGDPAGGQKPQHCNGASDAGDGRDEVCDPRTRSGQHRRASGGTAGQDRQAAHGNARAFPARRHGRDCGDDHQHHHRQE